MKFDILRVIMQKGGIMKKLVKYLLLCIVAVSLSGCFKSEVPKCSDEQVVKLVSNIYAENISDIENNPFVKMIGPVLPKRIVRIESARPVKYDENIKLRSCKGIAYFDDNRTATIEYTVQLDEKDSSQFYVELKMDFLEGLVQEGVLKHLFKQKR